MLNGILRSFAPQYIANRCLMFVELIGQCEETAFPKVSINKTDSDGYER